MVSSSLRIMICLSTYCLLFQDCINLIFSKSFSWFNLQHSSNLSLKDWVRISSLFFISSIYFVSFITMDCISFIKTALSLASFSHSFVLSWLSMHCSSFSLSLSISSFLFSLDVFTWSFNDSIIFLNHSNSFSNHFLFSLLHLGLQVPQYVVFAN